MNDKDSESSDYHPTIIETEDQKVEKRKPPNEKIIYYKIVDENDESESENNE